MSAAIEENEQKQTQAADAALISIGQASPAPQEGDDEQAKPTLTPAVALDDPKRMQVLSRLVLLNAVELLILAIVMVSYRAPFANYDVGTSVVDLILIDTVRAATVLASIYVRSAAAIYVAHAVNCLWLVSPLTAKFWVFTAWFDPPLFTLVVVLCPLVALLTLDGTWRVTAMDVPRGENALRLHSMLTILRPYFRPRGTVNQVMVIVTWVMLALGKAAGIISPIFLGRAVSKLSSDPMQSPYQDIGIFIALQFVPRLTTEVQDTLYVRVWQIAFIEAAETTFRHLHSLSLDWHLRKKMGNALRSMDRGLEAADSLMSYCLLNFLPALVAAFVSFALFAFHFRIREVAGVCHAGLAIYCWVTYALTVWRQKLGEETNVHDNDMHEKATDSLINFETVKYFGNEDYEAQRYVQSVREYQRNTYRSQWATSALNLTQSATINLTLLGALLLAARVTMMKLPGFGPGEFVAIQAYVFNVFSPLSYLGYLYTAVISALVNMQNLCDLLSEKADIVDGDGAPPLMLKPLTSGVVAIHGKDGAAGILDATVVFDHVTFRYPSQQPGQGLHDVSFSIPAGTTTAVVGETGSGKTTLSRLLFRFYDVLEGRITVGGQDIRAITQRSLRQVVGMVPQDTCMFHETIRYNLAYGKPEATDEELREVASKARILSFIESLSEKWDTVVGERGLKLSGGEKQRVAIARCLLKNPPIVILDEATSALDNATELEVQAALRSLAGRTTLIIAHRLTTIQHADQIIVMKKGRIVEKGTHEGLLATPNSEYAMLWRAQRLHEASLKHVTEAPPLRPE